MSKLRIRLKLNEGGEGAPLSQLVDVLTEAEKYFRYLAEDVGLAVSRGNWITTNFENGSLEFDAETGAAYPADGIRSFNHNFLQIAQLEPRRAIPRGPFQHRTLVQYTRIGRKLQPHEKLKMGLYRPDGAEQPFEWRPLSHRKAIRLAEWFSETIRYVGSIQGRAHSVTFEGGKSLKIRVLNSGKLVRCDLTETAYRDLVPLLEDENRLLFLRGEIEARRIDREIVSFRAFEVKAAPPFDRERFAALQGSNPGYTGDRSTEEAVRGDNGA